MLLTQGYTNAHVSTESAGAARNGTSIPPKADPDLMSRNQSLSIWKPRSFPMADLFGRFCYETLDDEGDGDGDDVYQSTRRRRAYYTAAYDPEAISDNYDQATLSTFSCPDGCSVEHGITRWYGTYGRYRVCSSTPWKANSNFCEKCSTRALLYRLIARKTASIFYMSVTT
ncbi:hypothetical protein BJF96_g5450 [Verticillium dahliae]|uniref:Uncharacterized protein n=1 Tax=Verticillium dahliae TaxID=27337 RepID=A0AA45ALE8_VERDA|nr:hypothetical protein BJF96_g5450 [Verticillium dahliae]